MKRKKNLSHVQPCRVVFIGTAQDAVEIGSARITHHAEATGAALLQAQARDEVLGCLQFRSKSRSALFSVFAHY